MTTTIKRAGDVKGTPDWQLDSMRDLENEKAWEAQEKLDTQKLRAALPDLQIAIESLRGAIHCMNAAAVILGDTPTGDKVMSVMDGLEDTLCDIKALRDICEGRPIR